MDKQAKENTSNKIRKPIFKILDIALLIFGIVAVSISGFFLFRNSYYEKFWVNGQSMYPTLNKDVVKANGKLSGESGGSASAGDKNLDFGLMDCHEKTLKKLKRFDIVCTYYTDEEKENKKEMKIKRIIGLPGDTFYFISSADLTNGDLYVKQNDSFVLINQPIENQYKCKGDYSMFKRGGKPLEVTLGEDEYYVCGDNRGYSVDSRKIGKIKFYWLEGKVVEISGHCSVIYNNGQYEVTDKKYMWPRTIK